MTVVNIQQLPNEFQSEIITNDNYNIFRDLLQDHITIDVRRLKRIYCGSIHGMNRGELQNRVRGNKNLVFVIKTIENKIFGVYVSQQLNYDNTVKYDSYLSMFSVDLNEWFTHREDTGLSYKLKLSDLRNAGLHITYTTFVLFGLDGTKTYYNTLDSNNMFSFNRSVEEIHNEIFGGEPKSSIDNCYNLQLLDVEVYQCD